QVALQARDLLFFDRLGPLVLLLTFPGEDIAIDYGAFDTRRTVERSVFYVAGLLAEDRPEEFFFRSKLGFALRRHLAHQNVARLDGCADPDDAALVEISQERFGDIRDVPRDLLRSQLGVARFDFELLDVDRGVIIFLHQLFADQDR